VVASGPVGPPSAEPLSAEPPSVDGQTPALHPRHGGLLPHWQVPAAEQVSAMVVSHAVQAPPPDPQADTDSLHVPSLAQHPAQVESHTQAPASEQCWPPPHAAAPPHVHAPPAEQVFVVVELHAWQVPPSGAQADADSDVQVVPVQHPVQDVESQAHALLEQCCPDEQSGPPPHVQTPLVQPSAFASQVVHCAPLAPQFIVEVDVMHVVPEQHPLGQDVALHTQAPPTHASWPQSAPVVPQTQTPEVEHVSALVPHALHEPPDVPHAEVDCGMHIEPEQHPLAHVIASHPQTPTMQCSFIGQELQRPPPDPHSASFELPGSQVLPEQQPCVHELLLHTHLPPEHACPVEHCAAPPQVHWPDDEHPSAFVASQALHAPPFDPHWGAVAGDTHWLPVVQHPFGHEVELQTHWPCALHTCPTPQGGPCPQLHAPADEQLLASLEVQATHAAPSIPQVANAEVMHVFPLQHPFGHEVELQTQLPPLQICPAPQGAEVPQLHAPALEQLSALVATQAAQAFAATPHVENVEVSHAAPRQQPLPQLLGVQAEQVPLASHVWGDGHVEHAEPPLPHAEAVLPGSQVVPEQHPCGHEVPLQTQAPDTHACPAAHAGPEPQAQAPELEQWSASAPHAVHALPAVPHAAVDAVSHTLP